MVLYFAGLAALVSPRTTIWFVDERLKRKAIAPTRDQVDRDQKRRVFYGSDRQYVEVMGTFPMDHDQWELLPQEILGMANPPPWSIHDKEHGHKWTWIENLLGGDGRHWKGDWFIETIQYFLWREGNDHPKQPRVPPFDQLDGTEIDRFGLLTCEFS